MSEIAWIATGLYAFYAYILALVCLAGRKLYRDVMNKEKPR